MSKHISAYVPMDDSLVADVVILLCLVMITLFPGDKMCDQWWA